MEKEHPIREGVILVIVMVIIVLVFTLVGYWDTISERRDKDREIYYQQSEKVMKKYQRHNSELHRSKGGAEGVNDNLNPKTKLSDLDKEDKVK